MRTALITLAAALLLAACSKVTQENFAKIETGMTEEQVTAILGKPDESTTKANVFTTSVWRGGDAEITIRLAGGKVVLKSFDKPAQK